MGWQGLGGRRERVPGRGRGGGGTRVGGWGGGGGRGGGGAGGQAVRRSHRSGRSPLKPSGGRFGLRPGAHAFCRVKKALDP